jgi:kumamolisin
VSLTVVLTPSNRTALRSLATTAAQGTAAARQQRLNAFAPATSGRLRTATALANAGFHVTSSGTWNLTATGTVGQAESLFGVQVIGSGSTMHPTTDPVIPSSFGGAATAVLGLDQRPVLTPKAVPYGLTPANLTSAYSSSASATAGAGATIATVQFSGWDSTRLVTYAAAIGRPLPSVTQVSVDGASTTTPDGTGGDDEVTIDQESLLATAPAAAQRIYFGDGTAKGIYDTYAKIAADESSTPITAVSTSWGTCETDMSSSTLSSLEDVIDRVVAEGATTFAASGDSGALCPEANNKSVVSVTYPASSPAVVAVGGSSLKANGSKWTETAWGDSSGASGGGNSAAFARPSYQSDIAVAGSRRSVPDIAEEASPSTGPGQYFGTDGGWFLGGGTSLASPLAAGAFSATLGARGCSIGVGDIHSALYSHTADFRDITTGSSGTYKAAAGYDQATGLGSPNWNALAAALPTASGCSTRTTTSTPPTSVGIAANGTSVASPAVIPASYSLRSSSGQFELTMQTDGNLVEYGNGRALWSTKTYQAGSSLRLLANGNLAVVDSSGTTRWSSGTSKAGSGVSLSLSNLGDVRLMKAGKVVWHNKAPGGNTMIPGSTLATGQALTDPTGKHQLVQEANGTLAVVSSGKTKWATKTSGQPGATFLFAANGNLEVVNGSAVWKGSFSKYGASGMKLTMQTDGNLVLYKGTKAIWSTKTS